MNKTMKLIIMTICGLVLVYGPKYTYRVTRRSVKAFNNFVKQCVKKANKIGFDELTDEEKKAIKPTTIMIVD